MLKCPNCGNVVDEWDLDTYFETHGHDGIAPIRERMVSRYCRCGWEYEEAELCKICGEYFILDSMSNVSRSVCEDCMEDYEKSEMAFTLGNYNKMPVKINGFVDFYLSEDEINEVLVDYVKKKITEKDPKIKDYCEEDKDYFGDFILEEIARGNG